MPFLSPYQQQCRNIKNNHESEICAITQNTCTLRAVTYLGCVKEWKEVPQNSSVGEDLVGALRWHPAKIPHRIWMRGPSSEEEWHRSNATRMKSTLISGRQRGSGNSLCTRSQLKCYRTWTSQLRRWGIDNVMENHRQLRQEDRRLPSSAWSCISGTVVEETRWTCDLNCVTVLPD